MSDKSKAALSVLLLVGVFALSAVGVYKGEVSTSAALATAMAALTSAGVLQKLLGSSSADEE